MDTLNPSLVGDASGRRSSPSASASCSDSSRRAMTGSCMLPRSPTREVDVKSRRLGRTGLVGLRDLHGNHDLRQHGRREGEPRDPRSRRRCGRRLLRRRRDLPGAARPALVRQERGDRRALARKARPTRDGVRRHEDRRAERRLVPRRRARRAHRARPAQRRARGRREPAAARHRLHRPVPDALARSRPAVRGGDGGARTRRCRPARSATSAAATRRPTA